MPFSKHDFSNFLNCSQNIVFVDGVELLTVVPLEDALKKIPVPPMEIVMERKEDLEIEELSPDLASALEGVREQESANSNESSEGGWKRIASSIRKLIKGQRFSN